MNKVIYLIGVPGAGKSTMAAALRPYERETYIKPVPHIQYKGGIQLGKREGLFAGTDRLDMAAQPRVLKWLAQYPAQVVFGEGDRLANDKFFQAVIDLGYELHLLFLLTSPDIAAARRQKRGTQQNEGWVKGRETKVQNLIDTWRRKAKRAVSLNGNLSVAALQSLFLEQPVIQELIGG